MSTECENCKEWCVITWQLIQRLTETRDILYMARGDKSSQVRMFAAEALKIIDSDNVDVLKENKTVKSVVRRHMEKVLIECGGSKTETAKVLGIARTTLHTWEKTGLFPTLQ